MGFRFLRSISVA